LRFGKPISHFLLIFHPNSPEKGAKNKGSFFYSGQIEGDGKGKTDPESI